MKRTFASRVRWSMLVVAGLGVCAVLADAGDGGQGEGPRGSPGLPVITAECDSVCQWMPSYLLGPADLQTRTVGSDQTQGIVHTYAHGMEINAYGHMYTAYADENGAAATLSRSSSGYGTVTVARTHAGPGHTPYMIIDWYPRFSAEAKVVEPDASCLVAGMMKGDSADFPAAVCAQGGASADTKEHDEKIKVSLGGLEIGLSSSAGDDNTDAPIDATHREKEIERATASFCCNCTVKVSVPGSLFTDWTQECEAWLWNSYPELDLHGMCPQCGAYAYGTYGWTL